MIIEIDNRYSAAFSSIVTLVRCGCDLSSIILSVTDTEIYERDTNNIYRLVDTDYVEDEQEHVLTSDGASWFSGVRGNEMNIGMASWLTLVANVAELYHKQCSFIEYDSNKISASEAKKIVEIQKKDVRTVVETFFPNIQFTINDLPIGQDYDDIYGVILKLSVSSGGTGESKPVLGKLFFQKASVGASVLLKPLSFDAAYDIDQFFTQNIGSKDESGIEVIGEVENSIINNVGSAVDEIVNKNSAGVLLNEAIIFDENDKKLIDKLHEKNPFIGITISDAKLLTITHVKWNNYAYDIVSNGETVLRVKFGINDNISLACTRCNEDLIVGGKISYVVDQEHKTSSISLVDGKINLTKDEIDEIIQYSAISEHLYTNGCSIATRGIVCQNVCCKSTAIDFENGHRHCANCPYPEVVFETNEQKLVLMKDMQYAYLYGKPALVDNNTPVGCCSFCGRPFANGEEYCELCANICSPTESVDLENAQKLYNKYRMMIPLGARLFNLFGKKYCFEDAEIIVFRVGNRGYYFEKTKLYSDKRCKVTKTDWRGING